MRRLLAALSTPIDPVVAVHGSSEDADATLEALGRAGYGRDMLAVVGRTDASHDGDRFPRQLAVARRNWAASGMAWGAAWTVFTVAATLMVPSGGAGVAVLLLLGVIALVLHVVVAWRVVAPASEARDRTSMNSAAGDGRPGQSRPCGFLVLVRGSRSDIALAKTILAL